MSSNKGMNQTKGSPLVGRPAARASFVESPFAGYAQRSMDSEAQHGRLEMARGEPGTKGVE
jgi:hypothetical protein